MNQHATNRKSDASAKNDAPVTLRDLQIESLNSWPGQLPPKEWFQRVMDEYANAFIGDK